MKRHRVIIVGVNQLMRFTNTLTGLTSKQNDTLIHWVNNWNERKGSEFFFSLLAFTLCIQRNGESEKRDGEKVRLTERVGGWVSEWINYQMSELQIIECAIEWVSEWVNNWQSDWVRVHSDWQQHRGQTMLCWCGHEDEEDEIQSPVWRFIKCQTAAGQLTLLWGPTVQLWKVLHSNNRFAAMLQDTNKQSKRVSHCALHWWYWWLENDINSDLTLHKYTCYTNYTWVYSSCRSPDDVRLFSELCLFWICFYCDLIYQKQWTTFQPVSTSTFVLVSCT